MNPGKLFSVLPFLLEFSENNLSFKYKTALASYWLYVGVPPENEGKAIDLLFQILLSNDTNVTIKSRALLVLYKLTRKYPELKGELKLCLVDQLDKHSLSFKKRAAKILNEIEL